MNEKHSGKGLAVYRVAHLGLMGLIAAELARGDAVVTAAAIALMVFGIGGLVGEEAWNRRGR